MSGSLSAGPTFYVGGQLESMDTITNPQAVTLNTPPPTMQFISSPSPAPQPPPYTPAAVSLGFEPSSSGTQYAGITTNSGLTSDQSYIGQYGSLHDYAVAGVVGAQAAGVAESLARGDFTNAARQGVGLAGSAYLGADSLGRVGMDLATPADPWSSLAPVFGSPGQ